MEYAGKTRDEILAALKELADSTKDEVTRQQILERIFIKRQLIVRNEEDKRVQNPFRTNPNLVLKPEAEFCDYTGDAVSCVDLDKNGNIYDLRSYELRKEEEQTVDDFRKDRFEFQFIKIPFDMEKGSCVKNIFTGMYGILA